MLKNIAVQWHAVEVRKNRTGWNLFLLEQNDPDRKQLCFFTHKQWVFYGY
jgi:hypothetical protein